METVSLGGMQQPPTNLVEHPLLMKEGSKLYRQPPRKLTFTIVFKME